VDVRPIHQLVTTSPVGTFAHVDESRYFSLEMHGIKINFMIDCHIAVLLFIENTSFNMDTTSDIGPAFMRSEDLYYGVSIAS